MEIITRQQAITLRLNKYFTGEPCRNGHVDTRYTHSSTCQSCITQSRPTSVSNRGDLAERRLALAEQKIALSAHRLANRLNTKLNNDLLKIRVNLHFKDVPNFKSFMWMRAFLIDQSVTPEDLLTRYSPKVVSEDRAVYTFRTFQANHAELYKMAKDLESDRKITDPIRKIPMDPKMAEAIANAQESPSALPLKARLMNAQEAAAKLLDK